MANHIAYQIQALSSIAFATFRVLTILTFLKYVLQHRLQLSVP